MKTIIGSTIKTAALTGVMAVVAFLGFASCDNETTSSNPTCKCPNGTTHIGRDTNCCDNDDCACVNQYDVLFGQKQITVKDKTRSIGKQVIQDALNEFETTFGSTITAQYVKNSSTEIVMIIDNIDPNYIVNGSTFSVSASYLKNNSAQNINDFILLDVFGKMKTYEWLGMNKSNSVIRLANGRDVNIDRLIAYGRQFGAAKQTVREAFRARGTQG
jgi:hypothetical protein